MRSESGVTASGMRGASDRKRRGQRSERALWAIGPRGAGDWMEGCAPWEGGVPANGNSPASDRKWPRHFSARRYWLIGKDLIREVATLISESGFDLSAQIRAIFTTV